MTTASRWLVSLVLSSLALPAAAAGPTDYFAVTPCRILDSRLAEGALQGPYQPGTRIDLQVTGLLQGQGGAETCGIPFPAARLVTLNVTAVEAAGEGQIELGPFGSALASGLGVVFFAAGQTRANNAVSGLCGPEVVAGCDHDLSLMLSNSAADVVIDVSGYFAGAAACGNAVCEAGEGADGSGVCGSCPQDCGPCCGDGICSEDEAGVCASDCPA